MKSKVPLQGAELEAHLQKERAVKEKEAAHQAAMARNQRMLEADEDESDSDSDEEEDEVEQVLGGDSMDISIDESGSDNRVGRRRNGEKNADGTDWTMDGDEGLTKQLLSYGGQTQRFRMFPYVEKKRRVDEYGETVDVGMWLRKGKVLEEDAESDEVKEMKKRQQADDDAKVGWMALSSCSP